MTRTLIDIAYTLVVAGLVIGGVWLFWTEGREWLRDWRHRR